MRLGFLTTCMPDRSLEEIAAWAAEHRFEALEVAAWPDLGQAATSSASKPVLGRPGGDLLQAAVACRRSGTPCSCRYLHPGLAGGGVDGLGQDRQPRAWRTAEPSGCPPAMAV